MSKDAKRIMADNFLAARLAIGKSQEWVAHESNIGVSTYRRLEAGEGNITIDVILKVTEILKMDITLIFFPARSDMEEKETQVQRITAVLPQLNKPDLDYVEGLTNRFRSDNR